MLTMPGEPYVEHQISFRDRLPGLDTILAGYANGYLGYIPTIRIAARDGVVYGGNAWPTTYALFSFASELRVRNPDPAS